MHVAKLRVPADDGGLIPAGRYFERLAAGLRDGNAREAARRERDEGLERRLEERYRRASAARANTYAGATESYVRL